MTENRNAHRGNGWTWAALLVGVFLVLTLTCAVSLLWGGMLGFALGRATAPERHAMQMPLDPFEFDPLPDLPQPPYEGNRPWLGVYYQMQEAGALVTRVIDGSPAQEARLQAGDIITEVDGRSVDENRPLGEIIQRYSPGDRIELTILRNGRERVLRVQLAAQMDMPAPIEPRWGG